MPLRIFRSRDLSGANVIQALSVAGMFGIFFLGALYLQRVRRYDALEIGLAFLPATRRHGHLVAALLGEAEQPVRSATDALPGMVLIVAGLVLFTRVPATDGSYLRDVLPTLILLGAGAGASFPALMTLAMSDIEPRTRGWHPGS